MPATLAQVEQAAAARLGPYETRTSNASSTLSLFVADDLASTATPGDLADRFLLRRGAKTDGTTISVATGDRQRVVKLYDPDGTQGNGVAGSLLVDRAWGVAPVAGEIVELHALDPARELRPVVLAGLDRCFVLDRVAVSLPGYAAERDVTASLPWLTRPAQVYGASYLPTGTIYAPRPVSWYRAFQAAGHVWLGASPDPYPYALLVEALRPASSLVNNLAAPPTPPATDVAGAGALLANTTYRAAVSANGPYGASPASVPAVVLTAADGANTHAVRLQVAQVAGANSYRIYLSTAAAPLGVATVTEAQRAAGCTVTAQDTVTATTAGAAYVDVRVAGTGAAAVQATGPTADADLLPVDASYAAAAACAEAWASGTVRPRLLQVAKEGMTLTRDEAVAWFTREAALRITPPPDRWEMSTARGNRTAADPWAGVL